MTKEIRLIKILINFRKSRSQEKQFFYLFQCWSSGPQTKKKHQQIRYQKLFAIFLILFLLFTQKNFEAFLNVWKGVSKLQVIALDLAQMLFRIKLLMKKIRWNDLELFVGFR